MKPRGLALVLGLFLVAVLILPPVDSSDTPIVNVKPPLESAFNLDSMVDEVTASFQSGNLLADIVSSGDDMVKKANRQNKECEKEYNSLIEQCEYNLFFVMGETDKTKNSIECGKMAHATPSWVNCQKKVIAQNGIALIKYDNEPYDPLRTGNKKSTAYIAQGEALFNIGGEEEMNQALEVFEQAIEEDPLNEDALIHKGALLDYTGRHNEAGQIRQQLNDLREMKERERNRKLPTSPVVALTGIIIAGLGIALRRRI